MTTSNTYGRAVDVPMVNKTGGQVILGDVVIYDTTNNDAFTTTTSAGSTLACGVAQETIASNGTGRIRTLGYTSLVNVNASVTRGHYGYTHTVVKQATDAGASRLAGTFLYFMTGGTTPDAIIYPVDLAGSALTNPMSAIGQMIGGTTAGAPAAISAGTAGQFIMSGGAAVPTFASRELDYVQITSSVNVTATTEATANTVVTGSAVAYDGSTVVFVEFWAAFANPATTAGANLQFFLYDGASSIGQIGVVGTPAANVLYAPVHLFRRLTPSNASHTYSIRACVSSGTGTVNVGAGGVGNAMPAFIRVTRAV